MALALKVAEEGLVLIKNEENRLPLSKSTPTVAVLGPNGNASMALLGNYYGDPQAITNHCQGISAFANVTCVQGCDVDSQRTDGFAEACNAAKTAAVTVLVMGINISIEGEMKDRTAIDLPGVQHEFIAEMIQCSPYPVILVIVGGGAVDIGPELANQAIPAVVWAGYGGQAGGTALANVLFGDVSPSGRSTQTWYSANFVNEVAMTDMGMRPNKTSGNPGRGYRYYTGEPIVQFGQGLSYTSFTYDWIGSENVHVLATVDLDQQLRHAGASLLSLPIALSLQVRVTNVGNVVSDVSVLSFVIGPDAGRNGNPIQSLADFDRISSLSPGESELVTFDFTAAHFSGIDKKGVRHVTQGEWKIVVEDSEFLVVIK
jgi:hypothetical protein